MGGVRTRALGRRLSASAEELRGNPLFDAHRQWLADRDGAARSRAIATFAFAVPTDDALDAIASHAPEGLVELGAGTGYWARLLADRGVDVVAYDAVPPPDTANPFFGGSALWHPVDAGDERSIARHPDRTLLIVWPTRESWATDAVRLFHDSGGRRLAFVGEGPGGRMGDDQLHAMLGLSEGCMACDYGLVDLSCVCDIQPTWALRRRIELPHWGGYEDDLYLFERRTVA